MAGTLHSPAQLTEAPQCHKLCNRIILSFLVAAGNSAVGSTAPDRIALVGSPAKQEGLKVE